MEPDRIGALIDRLGPGLGLFARQWCDSPEDVVQDAFVALATLPDEPNSPASWLYRAVRNGAINAGIAERRRRRRETAAGCRAASWFQGGPADRSSSWIDPESAQTALGDLPDSQREVIVAHLWGGLTFEQIAEIVQTSTSSAHRLYQAGLVTLRARLGVPCRSKTPRPDPN